MGEELDFSASMARMEMMLHQMNGLSVACLVSAAPTGADHTMADEAPSAGLISNKFVSISAESSSSAMPDASHDITHTTLHTTADCSVAVPARCSVLGLTHEADALSPTFTRATNQNIPKACDTIGRAHVEAVVADASHDTVELDMLVTDGLAIDPATSTVQSTSHVEALATRDATTKHLKGARTKCST